MELQILEEKYKNIVNKSEYEKALLKKEIDFLKRKLDNLEQAYIEIEKKMNNISYEKDELQNTTENMNRENLELKKELEESTGRIQELKDLSKTYKKMIKQRNEELAQSENLQQKNIRLTEEIELINNEKINLEQELKKKNKAITIMKEKYQKNIGRLLDKFNEKEKQVKEFQNFMIDELCHLKNVILSERRISEDKLHYNRECIFDEKGPNNYIDISVHLEQLTKKLEEKIASSRME